MSNNSMKGIMGFQVRDGVSVSISFNSKSGHHCYSVLAATGTKQANVALHLLQGAAIGLAMISERQGDWKTATIGYCNMDLALDNGVRYFDPRDATVIDLKEFIAHSLARAKDSVDVEAMTLDQVKALMEGALAFEMARQLDGKSSADILRMAGASEDEVATLSKVLDAQ